MKGSFRTIANASVVIILFAVLFSYAMFQGGFVSWFLFFSFLPIFIYLLGFLFYPIKKWKVTRDLSRHIVQAGDGITAAIRIERHLPFPLYYCIIEEVFPHSLMKLDSRIDKYHYMDQPYKLNVARQIKKLSFPLFRRDFQLSYSIQQIPRGEHQLQQIRVKTGDIFGFVKKEHVFEIQDEIIAHPANRSLHLTERISSFEQGSVTSNALNLANTNVAAGVREYVPGDRFSWIDWKQTARKNTVMTKEFEQEKSTDILLILDSCQHDKLNPLAFEAAVEVSLSLLEVFRKQDNQAGLLSIGDETVYFPIEENKENRWKVNQFLTRVQPGGDRPFSIKLKEEKNKVEAGDIVIFIVSHLDDFLKRTILQVHQRSKRAAVFFICSQAKITKEEQRLIQQIKTASIGIQILTEQQLVKDTIEVTIG
ncbi:DUF58 domain-containing protein [Oceanobacillus massiliensis]|uniref:DUF58 domain-containing protein n=1 Tax=Oceanobacillus massiliensis TaxID=1465765 RepID=UPI0002888F12|nr:DUF58 domain-containing protein [Oceanobacillus massiliensis]